jgi:hypothetical protein
MWSLTPPPSFDDEEDDTDSGRVIGPEDFIKEPAEEEQVLAEALAKTTAEEAERHAALRAVEEFKEREAARTARLAEAARMLLPPPPPPLLGNRHRRSRSPTVGGVRQAPVSSPGAEFCLSMMSACTYRGDLYEI